MQRPRKAIALCCLAAFLGFAALVALHSDADWTASSATELGPCLVCHLAATTHPVVAHVQSPAFVARVVALLQAFAEEAPSCALIRDYYIRPPPSPTSAA